jgi:hypothetical protein
VVPPRAPGWWSRLGRQAGDPVMQRPLGLTVLAPRARQAQDLRQPWPGGVVLQVGRGDEVPHLVLPAVPALARLRLPLVLQGQGGQAGGRGEEQADVGVERGLVLFDQQQIRQIR